MEIVFVIDKTLDKDFPTIAKCTRKCLTRRNLCTVDFAGPVERLSSVAVRRKVARNCALIFATTPKSENVSFTSDLTFDFSVLKSDRELENLIDSVESSLADFRFDASNVCEEGNSGKQNSETAEERMQACLKGKLSEPKQLFAPNTCNSERKVHFDEEITCDDGTRMPLEVGVCGDGSQRIVPIEAAAAALTEDQFRTMTATLPW